MLVVDASCLFEVVADGAAADLVRQRLALDDEQAAPHLIDAEVLSVIRKYFLRERLDPTAAHQALEDLRLWPGERYGHKFLLERAWELRDNLRIPDALYVALAEALNATLLTRDARLGRVSAVDCRIEFVAG